MAHRFPRFAFILSLVIGLSAALPSARGQTFQQPTAGTTGNWSSAALWTPGVPTSGTTTALTFQTLGGTTNAFTFTNDIGAFTVNSLSFNNYGTGLFTIALGANALTLDGTNPFLSNNGPGNNVISGAGGVVLNANTAVTGNGNGYLNISSIVSGAGGFTINQTGNGIFSLTGANTFSGGVTLTSGYLQLGNALALGNAANVLTINGGALRFSATATIANNIVANSTLVVAGGTGALTGTSTATLSGIISGTNGITIQNYGTTAGLTLNNANTISGAVNLAPFIPNSTASGGTLTLNGANGSLLNISSFTVGRNAALTIGGVAANANRIADTAPIAVNNGTINYVPFTAGTNETLGNVTLTGGLRLGTTAAGLSQLNFGTLTRNDNAIIWLTGTGFGQINSATVATLPTFTGGISTADNRSAGAETQIGILPFSVASSATNPRSFVTYDATNGLTVVPYNNATYVTATTPASFAGDVTGGTLTNRNIHLNGNGSYNLGGANLTVNAVTTTSDTVNISNGTLNIFSGVFVNFDSVIWDTGATLNFPSTGYIHQSWNQIFRSTAQITGSNGLVVGGYSTSTTTGVTTFENTNGNPFTGGLFVNGNVFVGYRQDNQLGGAAGDITLSGGGLSYNAAADLTISRNIKINDSGVFSNNLVATGGTAGNATATTSLTLSGVVSGTGALLKEGTGILNLTGTNTYARGTVITAGTLQFTTDANLGAAGSKITLNGGTMQPLAAINLSRPIDINTNSTINTASAVTLSGTLTNIGSLYGTAQPTLTKSGTGVLTIAGNASQLSGNISVAAGGLTLGGSGTNGGIPLVSVTSVGAGATLTLDNVTTGYNGNRIGDLSAITLGGAGAVASYLAPTTATSDPAERFGVLNGTVAGGVFSITGSAAGGTILRFNSLNAVASVTLRGDDLGGAVLGANVTRLFFDSFTTNLSVIPNVFFANTAGTATSSTPAGYDLTRGVIQFIPVNVAGSSINNFAPDNVPLTAAYTTNADATAATGVQIYSLTLDGGSLLTLNGGNAAGATNGNTPDGTLSISGGLLTSQNGAKTITSGVARIVSFGGSAATVTTTSDLTLDANVALNGSSSLTKLGTGILTLNGPYGVTGPLAIDAGTVVFGTSPTVGNLSGTGTISLGSNSLTINQTAPSTFAGTFSGGSTLTKTGTGAFTFAPTNAPTYAGGTVVTNGTLVAGSTNGASAIVSALTLGDGTLNTNGVVDLNGFSPATATTLLTTLGTGTGHQILNSNTGTASTLTLNLSADTTAPVAIGGNLIVNKNDANLLFLTGTATPAATTATRLINVNAGTFRIQSAAPVSLGMNFTAASGATLDFGTFGNNNTDAAAFGTMTSNGGLIRVTGGSGDLATNRVEFTGGTMDFTGTTNFWWHFRNAGAELKTNAASTAVQLIGVTGGSRIQNDTGAVMPINVARGTAPVDLESVSMVFSSAGSAFNKTGAGIFRISNTNNTAAFQVSGGTMEINGSTTGALTVNSGGTLIGTSAGLAGAVTVNAGGKVGGGDQANPLGTLTTAASTVINQNGSLRTVANASNVSSRLSLTGPTSVLNLNPGTGNTFGIELVSDTTAPLVFGTPYTITLATVDTPGNIQLNGVSQAGSTTFPSTNYVLSSPNFTTFNSVSLDVDFTGTNLVLQFTPVPEPATVLGLAALGLAAAGALRRRFRSKAVVA